MLGPLEFFLNFAVSKWGDKRPQQRYINQAKRLLAMLEKEMAGKDWIAAEQRSRTLPLHLGCAHSIFVAQMRSWAGQITKTLHPVWTCSRGAPRSKQFWSRLC